jgi:hypothetical protein
MKKKTESKTTSKAPKKKTAFVSAWTPENLKKLGKMPDPKLAELLGMSQKGVAKKRKSLQIEPFRDSSHLEKHVWTKAQLSWLGKFSDAEIARRIGVNATSVATQRKKLRIASPGTAHTPRRPWSKEELKYLGKINDVQFSRKFKRARRIIRDKRAELGIPPSVVTNVKPWNPAWDKKLGKKSDPELAKEFGVKPQRVSDRRAKLGIPGFGVRRPTVAWTEPLLKDLQKLSDEAMAKKHDIPIETIIRKRKAMAR